MGLSPGVLLRVTPGYTGVPLLGRQIPGYTGVPLLGRQIPGYTGMPLLVRQIPGYTGVPLLGRQTPGDPKFQLPIGTLPASGAWEHPHLWLAERPAGD